MNIVDHKRNISHRYGLESLPPDITKKEILCYFHLNPKSINSISQRTRLYPYRIAVAILVGSYKLIGRFPGNINETPVSIVKYLYRLFKIDSNIYSFSYTNRASTYSEHCKIAIEYLELKKFSPQEHKKLLAYLVNQSPDPGHYPEWVNLSEDYLRSKKYVLPPTKALNRIITSARHKGISGAIDNIYRQIKPETKRRLDNLIIDPTEGSWNQITNKRFLKASSNKINETLNSINEIRKLNIDAIKLNGIHKNYIKFFASRGIQMSSSQLNDQSEKSRFVLMAVTLKKLLSELTDISIQMNDEIISDVFLKGETKSNNYFKKNKKSVKSIISAFSFMSDTILKRDITASDKLKIIKSKIPDERMEELNTESTVLNIPKGTERLYFASNSYQKIQKYLPCLLETFKITSVSKGDPLVEAARYYLERKKSGNVGIGKDAPTDFVDGKSWQKVIFDKDGYPKTKPWIVCLADKMRSSLRKGTLRIEGTQQYKSLDSDLISWAEFKKNEIIEDKNLPYTYHPGEVLESLGNSIQDLSSKEKEWLQNGTASIDPEGKIHFSKLEKLILPETAIHSRNIIYGNLQKKAFTDVFIEADKLTGYSKQFTRLSSGRPINSTESKLGSALYSIIYAAACNIPLTKMSASAGIPLDFLVNLRDEILRPQTIQAAIALLVDFYSRLPLAQVWGLGRSSSSDGQGVVVEGNPLGARYNRKLFKKNTRGFIIYTHILDNYAPFFTQIFPAGPREAAYVADGLLYSGISLIPREHYTDTHGYTDIVFGVLYLLGFRFCPRIANIPDTSLWYLKEPGTRRTDIFAGGISSSTIEKQWESMQRVVHTIYSGKARASQVIRKISAFSKKHNLYRAFNHFGKLCKTRHILEMAGDPFFRREMLQGLNKGESRNAFSKEIRLGSGGIFKEKDPELRLCMVSATNLAILCSAICNTIEMQRTIRSLRNKGIEVRKDDLKFLSPFPHNHYNFIGKLDFKSIPQINALEIEKQFEPIF